MVDTTTFHYHLVKPEISGSPTTWGVKLNADLDILDQKLWEATNIGEIKMFVGGATFLPTNWLFCDGTIYANTAIPLLAPILNNGYGGVPGISNAVPNLNIAFPIGADHITTHVGNTGGEATHVLTVAETAAHNHEIYVELDDPGHTHTILDPSHNHDIAVNIYTASAGSENLETFSGSGGTTTTQNSTTGITINSHVTGITLATAGSNLVGGGAAHNNMPPYCRVSFIIKFQ